MPNAPSRPLSSSQPSPPAGEDGREPGSPASQSPDRANETRFKIYQGVIQPRGFPELPPHWISDWETYRSADGGLELFSATHCARVGHPRPGGGHRALLISHGLGEHGGRYLHFPHFLDSEIDLIRCPDHRGHGRSEGRRGHTDSWKLLADDLAHGIRKLDADLRKRHGRSEIHVLGHSLGSLVLLSAAFAYPDLPIRSLIVSSPCLKLGVSVPFLKRAMAGTLSKLWPRLQLDNELDPDDLSRDPEVAIAYRKDRLVHSKITPRLYTEMLKAMREVGSRESGLAYPCLAVVPLADRILNAEGALEFYRVLKVRDKRLQAYPGFYHESFNDIGKEKVFEDLRTWINQHSAGS